MELEFDAAPPTLEYYQAVMAFFSPEPVTSFDDYVFTPAAWAALGACERDGLTPEQGVDWMRRHLWQSDVPSED